MNTERKEQLIQQWGFTQFNRLKGVYTRDIFKDCVEMWSVGKPDVIEIFVVGGGEPDYKIDWSLFAWQRGATPIPKILNISEEYLN